MYGYKNKNIRIRFKQKIKFEILYQKWLLIINRAMNNILKN